MHGAALAFLYLGALLMAVVGVSRPTFEVPFLVLFVVPGVLVGFSIWKYKGNGAIHLLQFANLLSAAWTSFVGTMAVTGNWL